MTKEVPRTSVLRDEELSISDATLIARLQNSKGWPTLGNAAADRIEQLVATNEALSISNATLIAERATCEKYRDAYDEMGRIGTQAVRDLEAKLAALLDAAEKVINSYWHSTDGVITGIYDLESALARVKGEIK